MIITEQFRFKQDKVLSIFLETDKAFMAHDILQVLRDREEPDIATDLPWEIRFILSSLEEEGFIHYNVNHGEYNLVQGVK